MQAPLVEATEAVHHRWGEQIALQHLAWIFVHVENVVEGLVHLDVVSGWDCGSGHHNSPDPIAVEATAKIEHNLGSCLDSLVLANALDALLQGCHNSRQYGSLDSAMHSSDFCDHTDISMEVTSWLL